MPILLAIETSTEACSAALFTGSEKIERFEIAPQRHSDIILSQIESLLGEAGYALTQVDAIAFGSGPGSFMGVRIATGVAQGLAYGIDRPVIPVSTLQILAQSSYENEERERVIAAWDARMNAIYWGAYRMEGGIMRPIQSDCLNKPEEFSRTIIGLTENAQWAGVGNGWEVYESTLSAKIREQLTSIDVHVYPHARSALEIAKERFEKKEWLDPLKAEPVYIRNQVTRNPKET